jgi:hypothetical protein
MICIKGINFGRPEDEPSTEEEVIKSSKPPGGGK